ncbi:hypothetical protein FDUTEX481_06310 [Tolypothrix sp. PCC 7601]|uniref:hypothetical protein n=1 Tax=Tolypothrix sp. LEGE 11397 TaxID=2777971 RepID=UPI0005EAAEE0|nr:hypothetical protein [Tolypothrix sp. LEGE 11397]EKE96768.1 hypothetical protein FDUTEX481_06310 [Tolypothrix sp. PCC 7601]BAY95995.1 hypothetical protein NIES3275_80720 [Microchaete diplosiphon NIES-3275]
MSLNKEQLKSVASCNLFICFILSALFPFAGYIYTRNWRKMVKYILINICWFLFYSRNMNQFQIGLFLSTLMAIWHNFYIVIDAREKLEKLKNI